MSALEHRPSRFRSLLMATCFLAGTGILPANALAQDAGSNSQAHTCAASPPEDRGDPFVALSNLACGNGSDASRGNQADGIGNTAIGSQARANGFVNTAVGAYASAIGGSSVAIGFDTTAFASSSVALGSGASADRARTVSVGRPDFERQIVNVEAGTQGTDAVNLEQMNAGDVAALAGATAYTDSRETAIRDDIVAGGAAVLTNATAYTDVRETAVRTDLAAGDVATLATANTYADTGDARTLDTAITYADAGDARTLADARSYTDVQVGGLETKINGRFRDVNVRLDQVAAMGAAFSSMAGNSAGAGTGASNRLVVGVGAYGGETALSVGYARSISRRTAINGGVSFTGGEVMSGGSFGFAW